MDENRASEAHSAPAETPDDWYEIVRKFHATGLSTIAASPYSELNLPFNLLVFKTDTQCDHHCLVEGLGPEGRLYLMMKSMEMREAKAVAAIFQSDSRQIRIDEFTRHFAIGSPPDSEQWYEEFNRILREHGRQFGKLPKGTWEDVLLTGVKGPGLDPIIMRTSYHGDAQNNIVMGETTELKSTGAGFVEWKMLPDWWGNTTTIPFNV